MSDMVVLLIVLSPSIAWVLAVLICARRFGIA
jgi:hypothetical protein